MVWLQFLNNTSMSDLIGFEGYLNESTPFNPEEHNAVWKTSRRYPDFDIGHEYNESCEFPRFWNETGYPIEQVYMDEFKGCYNGEFDQVSCPWITPTHRSSTCCAHSPLTTLF